MLNVNNIMKAFFLIYPYTDCPPDPLPVGSPVWATKFDCTWWKRQKL